MGILKELYYSDICSDVKFHGKDSAFAELMGLLEKNKERLLASLNEDEKETFEKLTDAQEELDSITHYEKFSSGFKLGAMLLAEVFAGTEDTAYP